jgi:hypothetical protein
MTHKKTIYIWDGGVFSPPTRAVGKLAFNIATYMSSKFDDKVNVEYHFVPTNKYYNKPWVRCVDEDDRIHMLKNLVEYINTTYSVPPNVTFIVNEHDIEFGKREKDQGTTMKSLEYFNTKQLKNVYLSNSIDNIINRVNGQWQQSLNLFFSVHSICYDIYSAELIGVNQSYDYVYNSIKLGELLKQSNYDYPKEIEQYFKTNKITNKEIDDFVIFNKHEAKFEGLKKLIMSRIIFLPKHVVPETYKAVAGNRVREELDVYYSSLKNIQNFTTPGIEKYITDKGLYEHCKSRYVDKLISKKKKNTKNRQRTKTRSEKKSRQQTNTKNNRHGTRNTKTKTKTKTRTKTRTKQ